MERKVQMSKRFYLLAAGGVVVVIIAVVALVMLFQNMTGKVRRMSAKTIESVIDTRAIVIRAEQSVTESASDAKILCDNGIYVQEGTPIAVLYPYGYETSLNTICSRETELYTKLESQLKSMNNGELPQSVLNLNDELYYIGNRMRATSNGEISADYIELEAEFLCLMKDRRNLMVGQLSDASTLATEINALDQQYAMFETNMARTITSDYNGYVSFYTDSYEEPLKDVSQVTVSQVRRVLAATSFSVGSENFSYRIVTDRNIFYVAFVASTTSSADVSKRLMPGQSYLFEIKGINNVYTGTVVSEKDASNGILYIMAVSSDVQPLLDARVIEITIRNTSHGLTVPLDYIQYSNGVPYVFIKTDYGYSPIAVYIAGSNEEEAVIAARDEKLTLFSGLRYRMPIEEDD